jgi:Tol biopolymer transport system component
MRSAVVLIVCPLLFLGMILAAQTRQSDIDLQVAIRTETIKGDLKGAIAQYEALIKKYGEDDVMVATALLRMADCYQLLDDPRAASLWERIVRDYPRQRQASAARDRLSELRRPSLAPGEMMRRIYSGDGSTRYGTVSPDGKWLSSTVGGVFVHELATGTSRALVESAEGSYAPEGGSVISPDSRYVAYLWLAKPEQQVEIRIVPIDGNLAPQTVYSTNSGAQIKSWTPDGQNLLISSGIQMLMVSIQDRSVKTLLTQSPPNFRASISPDGRYVAYDSPQAGIARDIFILPIGGGEPTPAVRHSANDHSPLWSPDGQRLLFLSDRTAPASLWSVSVKDGKPEGEATLTKSDLGTIAPLAMTATGKLYYSRSGKSRNVFKAVLDGNGKISGTPEILTQAFVNSSWGPAVSFDGTRVAYYSDRPDTVLVIRNLSDGREREYSLGVRIRPNDLSGPKWLAGDESVLVNGLDSRSFLQLHEVELTDELVKPISSVTGVEVDVWPDGKSVLLEQSAVPPRVPPRLGRLDLSTKKVTPLELMVSPEIEATALQSPRVSHDGNRIAFVPSSRGDGRGQNDIVVTNAAGAEGRSVYRYSKPTDQSNTLAWSHDDRYILFTLFRGLELGIPGAQEIWRVPSNGGEAERIGPAMKATIKGPQVHPDGRSLFFTAVGTDQTEVWVLENFLPSAQKPAAR